MSPPTPNPRSITRWLKPLIAAVPLSAGIAYCFLLQLGFIALAPGFRRAVDLIGFRANWPPANDSLPANFQPGRSHFENITLVTCRADDATAGEKAIALFAVERGFSLGNRPRRFSVDAVHRIFVFRQPGQSTSLSVFARPQLRLEIAYAFLSTDPPALTALTARDKARFEQAGFRPLGSC